MPGFFNSADDNSYGTAASDYDRLSAEDPGAFQTGALGRLFDRLFAGQPKSSISRSTLPDLTPTSPTAPDAAGAPAPKAAGPSPSLSSGSGLLSRILKTASGPPTHNPQGEALVPGTSMTTPQFMEAITKAFQQAMPQFQVPGMGQHPPGMGPQPPQQRQPDNPATAAAANMVGGMAGPGIGAPPAPVALPQVAGSPFSGGTRRGDAQPASFGPPYGGNTFGGNRFGGNTYGGYTFGGRQFGASAPAGAPPIRMPGDVPPTSLPLPPRSLRLPPLEREQAEGQGFFRGGELALRRGGYPAQLLMGHGLPTRFATGDYVQPDGRGDGRSDHVQARLSPGEFVMDAETVSMLGNGDNEAGARQLEKLRRGVRQHKGRALAKGRFSPDAKQPDSYMRGSK